MTKDDTDNSKFANVYKKQEFESYILWRSMPSILRGQPKHVIEKLGKQAEADEYKAKAEELKAQIEKENHESSK